MKGLSGKLVLSVLFCLTLGIASGFSTAGSIADWYQFIVKPSWNPPNWLFGPVWTVLYILMGIALTLVWNSNHADKKRAILIFAIQFSLNLSWSFIFFNLHQIGWAFVEILIMLFAITFTTVVFYKINKTAGILLLPYLFWVSFASVLNGAIWYLNL